ARPRDLASSSAAIRLGLTLRSASPPPTERTRIASLALARDVLSHSMNTVAQPSSLVRAVSSETLSVGAYVSMSHSLRKSLTAWDAFAALPPTPRMNSRPPRARVVARTSATLETVAGSILPAISAVCAKKVRQKSVTPSPLSVGRYVAAARNRISSATISGTPFLRNEVAKLVNGVKGRGSQLEAGSGSIAVEHPHGIERVVRQIAPEQAELAEDVGRDGDDVAADVARLNDVEQLARTGPDDLDAAVRPHDVEGPPHHRHRIDAGVGDAAGKDGDDAGCPVGQAGADALHLVHRQYGGDVDLHAGIGEPTHERIGRLAPRVRHRD